MSSPAPTRLTDGSEVLRRPIHPTWAPEGVLQKTAFNPTAKDEKQLSTFRGYLDAGEVHRRWTVDKGNESIGTYGVSVEEVDGCSYVRAADAEQVTLSALDDAEARKEPDHASIDFRTLSKEQRSQAARKLRDHAVARGCLHKP